MSSIDGPQPQAYWRSLAELRGTKEFRALLESEPFLAGRMITNMLDRLGSAAFLAAAERAE